MIYGSFSINIKIYYQSRLINHRFKWSNLIRSTNMDGIMSFNKKVMDKVYNISYYFIVFVKMKGKDLFSNIQEAREHILRLKKQAEQLEQAPQEEMAGNINEYMNEVIYTLNKNEQQIDKKHKQYKQKLPLINKKEEISAIAAFKRHRQKIHSNSKNIKEESTKIEDSFSFVLENRPIKMHSHHEKVMKAIDFTTDRINSQIEIPLESRHDLSKRSTPVSAHFRSRHFEQKKAIKQIEFMNGSRSGIKNSSYLKINQNRTYSQEFQMIKGIINYDTPEFASFQRIYESIFPKIKTQLSRLSGILKYQMIEYIKLDGKKLAYLCLKDKISEAELLSCLINLLVKPSDDNQKDKKFGGKDGKAKAVTFIASYWRMRNIRQKFETLKRNTIVIQRFFKKQLLRLKLQKSVQSRNEKIMQSFETRQIRFAKEYRSIRQQKRIQIHIASVEVDEQKRLSMDYFPQRQNIQLSRIFRLKDPNLIIIYISSTELQPQLLNYYYKIMELAGIDNYRERLIFMSPEHSNRFPEHVSTTKVLYYSTRTLNQLKIITSDLPTILYPGQPCNELLKICDHLNCYLFTGEPQRMKAFTTKSQTKRLLTNLCIQTLPSAMEMYDFGEFLNTFSVLIAKNPSILTWVLKIDDQIQGRGIAFADFGGSKYMRTLLKNSEQKDPETFATQVTNDPQQQQLTVKVRDYLREHLHQRLQVATPSVYRGFTDFMGRFIKKGGIIEAHPVCLPEQIATASVCFELGPDGQHRIITTFQKINGQPYRSLACYCPQKILDSNKIASTIRQLSDSFKLRKMFGIFTVDFLVQKQTGKFWVIGIDPYLNDYAASYYLFDMLMDGAYMADKNMYLVDVQNGTQTEESSPEERLKQRQYVFVPHLHHRNLSKVRIKQFFREARMQQFNFDVGNREGVCVLLLDQMASGLLGLLSVSASRETSFQSIKRMLDFISRVSSVKNVQYGKTQLSGSTDVTTLKDVLSVFAGYARKGARKNAKQKAIRHFEMNRNLQLL